MTTERFKAIRDEAERRDLRTADLIVAAAFLVLTISWAAFLASELM